MQYFDFNAKSWKSLTSLAPLTESTSVFCAESFGCKIIVAGSTADNSYIYCSYDLENNVWKKQSQSHGELSHLCTVETTCMLLIPNVLRFLRGIAFLNDSGKVLQK